MQPMKQAVHVVTEREIKQSSQSIYSIIIIVLTESFIVYLAIAFTSVSDRT